MPLCHLKFPGSAVLVTSGRSHCLHPRRSFFPQAASIMDLKGSKQARSYISMIKVAAPRVALKVIDDAIQIHGAHGVRFSTP